MKNRILSLAIGCILALSATAQQSTTDNYVAMSSTDSSLTEGYVANTASKIMAIKVKSAWDNVSFQAVITKVSGTVGGTAILVGSDDGVNFVTISRPSIAITALRPAFTDTLTPTNVTTNTRVWVLSNSVQTDGNTPVTAPYLWYGIKYTGTGTMVAKIKGFAVLRHK